jgi:hypothetical protein
MKRIKERITYLRPLLLPLVLYLGFTATSFNWIDSAQARTAKILLALLPMVPAAWFTVGIIKAIGKLDELERKIILEAAAFSFVLTLFALIALMLLGHAGVPLPNPAYIAVGMSFLLLVAKLFGNWRHQ